MAVKYDAPSLTIPMTQTLDRGVRQFSHDNDVTRADLARVGLQLAMQQPAQEIKNMIEQIK